MKKYRLISAAAISLLLFNLLTAPLTAMAVVPGTAGITERPDTAASSSEAEPDNGGEDGFGQAVSYTHLDVYKRQTFLHAEIIPFSVDLVPSCHHTASCTIRNRIEIIGASGCVRVPAGHHVSVLVKIVPCKFTVVGPVSYTHLSAASCLPARHHRGRCNP